MRWERAMAVALTAAVISAGSCTSDQDEAAGDCLRVDVTTSPEKQRLMEDLAARFNRSPEAGRGGGDGCVRVAMHTLSSGLAEQLLREGWPHPEHDGPAPVLWTPASSAWAVLLAGHRDERLAADEAEGAGEGNGDGLDPASIPIAVDNQSLARTPLVIAMPRSRAEALGWPDEEIGFTEVLALVRADLDPPCDQSALPARLRGAVPEWCGEGPFSLGKTNPHVSTSGLGALVTQAHAATGQQELTVAALEDPAAANFTRDIESSVAHYGDTTLTFLDNWFVDDQQDRPPYVDAVAVEEKSVIDYNRGDPTGLRLEAGETGPRPNDPIAAIYPSDGTFWSDNPAFVLDVDWVSDGEAAAARRFVEFVRAPGQQRLLLDYGFRPVPEAGVAAEGPFFSEEYGVDPATDVPQLDVPDGEVLDLLLRRWDEQRRSARVLFVIDVSDSMACPAHQEARSARCDDPEDVGATSKLDVAQRALTDALVLPAGVGGGAGDTAGAGGGGPLLKPDDVVGMWAFSTQMGDDRVYGGEYDCADAYVCEMLPPSPYDEISESLPDAIGDLHAHRGTPLYHVVDQAFRAARESYDRSRINAVVVLSDGDNNDDDDADDRAQFTELLDTLGGESQAETPIRVFTIAYGPEANRDELTEIAEASDAAFYDASDTGGLERIFAEVVSNF